MSCSKPTCAAAVRSGTALNCGRLFGLAIGSRMERPVQGGLRVAVDRRSKRCIAGMVHWSVGAVLGYFPRILWATSYAWVFEYSAWPRCAGNWILNWPRGIAAGTGWLREKVHAPWWAFTVPREVMQKTQRRGRAQRDPLLFLFDESLSA